MKKIYCLIVIILIYQVSAYAGGINSKRFGIFIGANSGGTNRPMLKYAQNDVMAMADLLNKLGGIEKENELILMQPTPEEINSRINNIKNYMEKSKFKNVRKELIFYYSGHSDQEGLLLAGKLYDYKSLKALLQSIPADITIIILDSCSSVLLLKLKAGKHIRLFFLIVL